MRTHFRFQSLVDLWGLEDWVESLPPQPWTQGVGWNGGAPVPDYLSFRLLFCVREGGIRSRVATIFRTEFILYPSGRYFTRYHPSLPRGVLVSCRPRRLSTDRRDTESSGQTRYPRPSPGRKVPSTPYGTLTLTSGVFRKPCRTRDRLVTKGSSDNTPVEGTWSPVRPTKVSVVRASSHTSYHPSTRAVTVHSSCRLHQSTPQPPQVTTPITCDSLTLGLLHTCDRPVSHLSSLTYLSDHSSSVTRLTFSLRIEYLLTSNLL